MPNWLDTPNQKVPGQPSTTWGLEIPMYDTVEGDPNLDAPTTITFKKGGTTVAVLALTYSGTALTKVVRTS